MTCQAMTVSLRFSCLEAFGRRPRGTRYQTYSRLQVYQNRSWDVPRVVALVVKHVFPIAALCREIFEVAVLVDPVLLAQLLPELAADCVSSVHRFLIQVFSCSRRAAFVGVALTAVTALASLDCDDLAIALLDERNLNRLGIGADRGILTTRLQPAGEVCVAELRELVDVCDLENERSTRRGLPPTLGSTKLALDSPLPRVLNYHRLLFGRIYRDKVNISQHHVQTRIKHHSSSDNSFLRVPPCSHCTNSYFSPSQFAPLRGCSPP